MGLTVLEIEAGNPANPLGFLDPLRRELKHFPMILAFLKEMYRSSSIFSFGNYILQKIYLSGK